MNQDINQIDVNTLQEEASAPVVIGGNSVKLPDVSHENTPKVEGVLDCVGMKDIEMPIRVTNQEGEVYFLPARLSAYVNLMDPKAKGIHMSRLYLLLDKYLEENVLSQGSIEQLLKDFVTSQGEISDSALIKIRYSLPVKRPALKSNKRGWREYPIYLEGQIVKGEFHMIMGAEVTYSSTCPCSAALARQLVMEKFANDFDSESVKREDVVQWLSEEKNIIATPHAQRSFAEFKVRLQTIQPVMTYIDAVENALKTPVQSAVKRVDEQEFARLNGSNLMFCEDAARVIKKVFNDDPNILDFWAHVSHRESLHPHDATAIVTKGIEGGFIPVK
ncbi:MAG: GTP cyclohydrolase I FolE2 [Bdellovibrionales bacterium]|nr:GTP cyclohydrolase I FolE2 [Bdellovibrionales bacterium]